MTSLRGHVGYNVPGVKQSLKCINRHQLLQFCWLVFLVFHLMYFYLLVFCLLCYVYFSACFVMYFSLFVLSYLCSLASYMLFCVVSSFFVLFCAVCVICFVLLTVPFLYLAMHIRPQESAHTPGIRWE